MEKRPRYIIPYSWSSEFQVVKVANIQPPGVKRQPREQMLICSKRIGDWRREIERKSSKV